MFQRVIRRAVGSIDEPAPQPAIVEPAPQPSIVEPAPQPAIVEPAPQPSIVELFTIKEAISLSIPQSVLEKPDSLRSLGIGSFGQVYLYESSSQKVAIKQVACETNDLVKEETLSVFAEIEVQKKLDHINIVQYFGSYRSANHILIIMEYAEIGSLRRHLLQLEQRMERLSDDDILDFTRQITTGLDYLHTQDKPIIHRDLRSANVLMFANNIVKIADFGISKQLNTLATRSGFQTIVGNTFWQAPEMIEYNEGKACLLHF